MVTLDKITHLAAGSSFDTLGRNSFHEPDIDLGKAKRLGYGIKRDVCSSTYEGASGNRRDQKDEVTRACVYHAWGHNGRRVSLFKTLFTNSCYHECNYCINASNCTKSSKILAYTPEELARITMKLYREKYIEGLFLSSGAGRNEEIIMEKMIESAKLLREKYSFKGYIHLKILPGTSLDHIKQAVEPADRVSINIETTSPMYMNELSPTKDYRNDIISRQQQIKNILDRRPLPGGQTTQLVVGGSNESDREIFDSMLYEYKKLDMRRVYYSSFHPIDGTAYEKREAQPLWREHRLYQMDWLYRIYNLDAKEIGHAFEDSGYLPNTDPKTTIAREIMDGPMDPNQASYRELIRVPGIGPKSASRIVMMRKREKIIKREQLRSLGAVVKRARPFIKLNGWCDSTLDRWVK